MMLRRSRPAPRGIGAWFAGVAVSIPWNRQGGYIDRATNGENALVLDQS
jgi:hypothetical protein